jgi:fumarate reductase, flavoprotein subunit
MEDGMKKNFLGRFLGLTALMFTLLFTTASAEVYEGTGYGYHQNGIVLGV